jgi:hypothetical protein
VPKKYVLLSTIYSFSSQNQTIKKEPILKTFKRLF